MFEGKTVRELAMLGCDAAGDELERRFSRLCQERNSLSEALWKRDQSVARLRSKVGKRDHFINKHCVLN